MSQSMYVNVNYIRQERNVGLREMQNSVNVVMTYRRICKLGKYMEFNLKLFDEVEQLLNKK